MRAKPSQLHKPEDGATGRNWTYHLKTEKMDDCFKPDFWAPVKSNLMMGDSIRLISYSNDQVSAVWDAMVVHVDRANNYIILRPAGKMLEYPRVPRAKEAPEPEVEREEFIKGSGVVSWNLGKKRFEVKVDDQCVFDCEDKEMAHRVARGDIPIPKPVETE